MINQLKIGPVVYTVRETALEAIPDEDEAPVGQINFYQREIRIDPSIDPALKSEVLWHEIMHAILHQTGHADDEDLVMALGYGIFQVIQENPTLLRLTLQAGETDGR